ncbi:hypothetical protein ACFR99_15935 [Haloarchaeobius amylolyticus]|uniref:DUF7975 domain-containing protein n=1 Tax=Haloarchaeobius amylolyticus TaxID=1198296 RepID=A0ABD6BJY9_9EURY
MTRFDASEPAERRKLYVDAITAHRERGSRFLTLEADDSVRDESGDSESLGTPWIQFGDGTINIDCTDAELETLKALLEDFPAFKIDDLTRPEEAEGTNVRISAKADPNRIAQFIDEVFLEVYEFQSTVRVWLVDV